MVDFKGRSDSTGHDTMIDARMPMIAKDKARYSIA
jgi:hypothetical protein